MSAVTLSRCVVFSKYANPVVNESRRETWHEIVDRSMQMHRKHLAGVMVPELAELLTDIQKGIEDLKVLFSMRSGQFGGVATERKHARMYNCGATALNRPRAFAEIFWAQLCGCGTGISLQDHHVAQLPKITKPRGEPVRWTISDDIEGWAYGVAALLASHGVVDEGIGTALDKRVLALRGHPVHFHFTRIRRAGSRLSTGNGLAPGPKPLKKALKTIRKLLSRMPEGYQMDAVDCADIINITGDAVMSGGVRRSAAWMGFSPWNEGMLDYKTGNWGQTHPWRARANISAVLLVGEDERHFAKLKKRSMEFGEPAIVWTRSREFVWNPCVEIGMYPFHWKTGAAGWQFCNLSTINATTVLNRVDFLERCRLAAALGTIQASYTKFEFLGQVTQEIVEHEALIGVSMTGIYDNYDLIMDPALLEEGAGVVLSTNKQVAQWIGINQAARGTTIKPEGTASLVVGSASGVHPWSAPVMLRRMRLGEDEPLTRILKRDAPWLLEELYEPGYDRPGETCRERKGYTAVFRLEAPDPTRTEKSVSGLDMLDTVLLLKKHWVNAGTNVELCVHPDLRHNVSNTIKVHEHEIDEVFQRIYDNKDLLNGVSWLRKSGNYDWIAPPYVEVEAPQTEIAPEVLEAFFGNKYWLDEESISEITGLPLAELRKQYYWLWSERLRTNTANIKWGISGDDVVHHAAAVACGAGGCELI